MKIVVALSGVTDQRRALSNHSVGLSLVACFRRRATSHAPSQKTSTRPESGRTGPTWNQNKTIAQRATIGSAFEKLVKIWILGKSCFRYAFKLCCCLKSLFLGFIHSFRLAQLTNSHISHLKILFQFQYVASKLHWPRNGSGKLFKIVFHFFTLARILVNLLLFSFSINMHVCDLIEVCNCC